MKWLLLCLACFLPACASAQGTKASEGFTELPQELRAVDWTRTPEDVLNSPNKDEPLVWVGLVEEVLVSRKGSQVEIIWICKHLRFAEPGSAAISRRPIKVKEGAGSFAVSLVANDMSMEEARKFQKEHTALTHYLLAGGTFDSLIESHGRKVPFLYTYRMALGPKLAERANGR